MFFAGDLSFPKRFDHDTAAYFCAGERCCFCSVTKVQAIRSSKANARWMASTQREWTKNWLDGRWKRSIKALPKRLFGAMKRGHVSDW